MKFTLSWLKDHLDTSKSLDEICAALTDVGLELESLQDNSAALKPFKIAKIIEAKPHPDAAKLQVCTVDNGAEKLQVVCGAANARVGLTVALAEVGTVIPNGGMVIKKAAIRGVESNGMLCSEEELGLADASEGIMELPSDLQAGASFAAAMGFDDPVIELNVTPDRADCLGVRGVARDLAAAGLGKLKALSVVSYPLSENRKINVEIKGGSCKQFIGRYISGVKNGPSPAWLQQRLKAIGLRPISALVDITNYVTFDLCRPLHVFDAAKITSPITPRLSQKGESIHALNGKDYVLDDKVTVIADAKGVVGIGGIIGGEASGCTETTTEVFLECAYFDAADIATTGRRFGIDSDARYRFERGVDPEFLPTAVEIATRMIIEICGGSAGEVVVAGSAPEKRLPIKFALPKVATLTGVEVSEARAKEILVSLGFEFSEERSDLAPLKSAAPAAPELQKEFYITPPSWRHDVTMAADIVEEIVRVHGFKHIPSTPLPLSRRDTSLPLEMKRLGQMRRTLAARGLSEVHSWSFIPHEVAKKFGGGADELRLINPISSDLDSMRPSIMPALLEMSRRNHERGMGQVALFEAGYIYGWQNDAPTQSSAACGIRSGEAVAINPHAKNRDVNLFDAKADALAALEAAGAPVTGLQTSREVPAWYHPGKSGVLKLGKNIVACFGEIHPQLLADMDIKFAVAGFEIFPDALPAPKNKSRTRAAYAPSQLMPLSRDYSFLLSQDALTSALVKAMAGAEKNLISNVEVISIYQDAKLAEAGKNSVAVRVTIQPTDNALTDADINRISAAVIRNALTVSGCELSESLSAYIKEKQITI